MQKVCSVCLHNRINEDCVTVPDAIYAVSTQHVSICILWTVTWLWRDLRPSTDSVWIFWAIQNGVPTQQRRVFPMHSTLEPYWSGFCLYMDTEAWICLRMQQAQVIALNTRGCVHHGHIHRVWKDKKKTEIKLVSPGEMIGGYGSG